MGVYDTVIIPCPKCGEPYHAQSKSGECNMDVYKLSEAPSDVLENVNRHAPFVCSECNTVFLVELETKVKGIKILTPNEYEWDL